MITLNDHLQLEKDCYKIIEPLGIDKQSTMWKARRESDASLVALKSINTYLSRSSQKKQRKPSEVKALSQQAWEEINFLHTLGEQAQKHYIVACLDKGVVKDASYGELPVMVMPLYEHNLATYYEDSNNTKDEMNESVLRTPSQQTFSNNNLLKWVQQITTALAFIHQHQQSNASLKHQTIEPANLMLNEQGDIGLIDWMGKYRVNPPAAMTRSLNGVRLTVEQLWQLGHQEEALTQEIRKEWLLSYQHKHLSQIKNLAALMRLQAFYQSLQQIHPNNNVLQRHIEQTILSPIFLRDSLPFMQKKHLPEMQYIEGGIFQMGSELSFNERPHEVTLNDFFMAKTVVTVKQYMECVKAGFCRPPEWVEDDHHHDTDYTHYMNRIHDSHIGDEYKQLGKALTGDNYPIVGVNWDDATAYAEWLKCETGEDYRLPTEAEWEYAARAESEALYPWGNEIDSSHANYQSCDNRYTYTSPVGCFSAYGGLYDMQGNVWEWTASAYDACYDGSETVCATAEDTRPRVLRGGSWRNRPWKLRSAGRYYWLAFAYRDASIGFRLAKSC